MKLKIKLCRRKEKFIDFLRDYEKNLDQKETSMKIIQKGHEDDCFQVVGWK